MEWLVWLGVGALVVYEILAASTGKNHTISEWFWRLFKRRPWTRWVVLGALVVFTLHIVGELWGYADPRVDAPVTQEDPCN
jgi:hypothetical protein